MNTLEQLERENAELKAELAQFQSALQRDKGLEWERSLKMLAHNLEALMDTSRYATEGDKMLGEAARQLRYMADCFTLKANFVPTELRIKELEAQCQKWWFLVRKNEFKQNYLTFLRQDMESFMREHQIPTERPK